MIRYLNAYANYKFANRYAARLNLTGNEFRILWDEYVASADNIIHGK